MDSGNSAKFWRAREAFERSNIQKAKAKLEEMRSAGVTASAIPERIRAQAASAGIAGRWIARINKFGFPHKKHINPSWVQIDPALMEKFIELAGAAHPAIVEAYDKYLGNLANTAFIRWPVYSGLSKSMLALEYSIESGNFVGSFGSTAPYTFYIGKYHKPPPHLHLIARPGKSAAQKIGEQAIGVLAGK